MIGAGQGTILVSMFLTGLAGSLHCVGMCGPILLGFSKALGGGKQGSLGFFYYHGGRLWTYGLLGLLAGLAGSGMSRGSVELGWQRPLSVLAAILVIGCAVAALGLIPGLRLDLSPPGSCWRGPQRWPWLAALLHAPRPVARLLLGAVMGLLPCGLVYAVLLVAANLANPLLSALGMLSFGLGTLPALSAVVLGGRLWPKRWRIGGSHMAAALLLAVGLFMLGRALLLPMAHGSH